MFEESPFQGLCEFATYEVAVMLVGTFVLGVILGYLIWGWLKREVNRIEQRLGVVKSIARAHEVRAAALLMRLKKVQDLREHAESKLSLAEFRLTKAQEDIDALRERLTDDSEEAAQSSWEADESPTLAAISSAMSTTSRHAEAEEDGEELSPLYHRGIQRESLEVAEQVFGFVVIPNDLKLIKGIGPKIEELLHRAGISSWAELAMAHLPILRQTLEEAGPRYRIIDPKTWPVQARMAAKGEWRKLRAYQETLGDGAE